MLEAKDITYSTPERTLIKDISLQLLPGTLCTLIGPNGSGKSTLLKNIMGIWKPTSGHVVWKGENLLDQERQTISKTLSLVPQSTQMPFNFPVLDIVKMGRYTHKTLPSDLIEWALKIVDAWHLRHRQMLELSSGEQQRIYIARALVTESPVLLLDEPTANLDIRHQLEIWHLLQFLAAQGKIILVANHDLITTQRFSDHVIVLKEGRSVASGTYKDIVTPDLLHHVFGVIDLEFAHKLKNTPKKELFVKEVLRAG